MSVTIDIIPRLLAAGQAPLARHLESLPADQAASLRRSLAEVDFTLLTRLITSLDQPEEHSGDVAPFPAAKRGDDPARDAAAVALGERLLREGRVAAFVVAGGQGTRLGHEGPKGTYPATPLTGKPLFRVFAEKILAKSRFFGAPIPLFVMTSPLNHEDTVQFFEANGRFGLGPDQVTFFTQGTMPAVTPTGELILAEEARLFESPDGHGGSLRALSQSGSLARMKSAGIEHIFYFQVDNPLVNVCDPYFLGLHALVESDYSCKVVSKRDPGEKVGVVARRGGKPCVIEYSDLPEALRDETDATGTLRYKEGSIAIHALSRAFVESVNEGGFGLPFHQARKKIPAFQGHGIEEIEGIKFETFVFDALPMTREALVLETPREEEFSPIKNRDGQDSPETSLADQVALHSEWLAHVGVTVPRDATGRPVHRVEISPLFADSLEALRARRAELPDRIDRDYLFESDS